MKFGYFVQFYRVKSRKGKAVLAGKFYYSRNTHTALKVPMQFRLGHFSYFLFKSVLCVFHADSVVTIHSNYSGYYAGSPFNGSAVVKAKQRVSVFSSNP
jgi:hypothetical protein